MPLNNPLAVSHGSRLGVSIPFWEKRPAKYETFLNTLRDKGVRQIILPMAWSAIEDDTRKHFLDFLTLAASKDMAIMLVVTLEAGCALPYGGIPARYYLARSNWATDPSGRLFSSGGPPHVHALLSLHATPVRKEYIEFIDRLVQDVQAMGGERPTFDWIVGDSLFKYYRQGDHSKETILRYHAYLSGETDTPARRQRLVSLMEREFLEETMRMLRKGGLRRIASSRIGSLAKDPDGEYGELLREVFGGRGTLALLLNRLDRLTSLSSTLDITGCQRFWDLDESERGFLVLSALLSIGFVSIEEGQLAGLRPGFLKKLDLIDRYLESGSYEHHRGSVYVTPSRWLLTSECYREFSSATGPGHRRVEDLAHVPSTMGDEKGLIMLDPAFAIAKRDALTLVGLAHEGHVVVVDKRQIDTDALDVFKERLYRDKRISMSLGASYDVIPVETGKLVLLDSETAPVNWPLFLGSMMSLADIKSPVVVTPDHVRVHRFRPGKTGRGYLLFLTNPTRETLAVHLVFGSSVSLRLIGHDSPADASSGTEEFLSGDRFNMDLQPLGVTGFEVVR